MKRFLILLVAILVATTFVRQSKAQTYYYRYQTVQTPSCRCYVCPRCGRLHRLPAYSGRQTVVPNGARRIAEPSPNEDFVGYANRIRSNWGLPSLSTSAELEEGSRNHANWMARAGSPQHASGGFRGEIICYNYSSPREAFNQWLNSSGHRHILLSSYYRRAGFGYCRDSYGRYWCVMRFM